jgi:para-aminobenzoate synthetase component I
MTSKAEYQPQAADKNNVFIEPYFEEIPYTPPIDMFQIFADKKWNMLMDSADGLQKGHGTNRYSYILIDPFDVYILQLSDLKAQDQDPVDPLADLRQLASRYRLKAVENLPPFQGGLAGYLSYDLTSVYHPVPMPKNNDLNFPEVCIGFYDLICAFDHLAQRAYIIASGWPETQNHKRQKRIVKRIEWFKQQINSLRQNPNSTISKLQKDIIIKSNFTKAHYLNAVEKIIEYIRAGDIFEVNLTQRFEALLPDGFDDYALFKKLCRISPSPFAAYLNLAPFKILSASPERFIKLQGRAVETRPIKGTRARSSNPQIDEANKQHLLNSEKDIAENIMIVDLMRNDLSKVCEDDSVIVHQLCGHEAYPTVHHLVSVILGQLNADQDAFSLLKGAFPGGSITGAPKIRAMQIINEIEPKARGPYCGNIVLIGFDGNMDSSIVIRSYVIKNNYLTFHAGGAIVLDSSPLEEYEETLSKSYALRMALTGKASWSC